MARRLDAVVEWAPVLLGGLHRHYTGSGRPTRSASRVRYIAQDLRRTAAYHGVTLRMPAEHPRRTVDAMRLCLQAAPEVRGALSHALYRAYWVEGEDVARREVLASLAEPFGVDAGRLDEPAVKRALFQANEEAIALGVFSVPSFQTPRRLWWGGDRLALLEAAEGGPRVEPELPEATRPPVAALTFYFDFACPYSYLAAARVEAVARRQGATVRYRPVLLGGLLRAVGRPVNPEAEMHAARRAWVWQDLADHAAFIGVSFQVPPRFPIRTVTALRVSLVEPATVPAVFQGVWGEGRDIGVPRVLQELLDEAGFDGATLLARAGEEGPRQALWDHGREALEAGVLGTPGFQVADQLLWGQDRLDQVEALLRGWVPPSGPAS